MRPPIAGLLAAVALLAVGCGSGNGHVKGAGSSGPGARDTTPSSAPSRTVPAPRGGVTRKHAVAGLVKRATTTCMDRPRDRRVKLPPKLARLTPPLRAAQAALVVAQRTEHRLAAAPPPGARGQDLVAVAKARLQAMLSVNYAIERHDRTALAISTGTVSTVAKRLDSDARRFHACR